MYLKPTVIRVIRIIIAIIMITLYMLLKFRFSQDKSTTISTASQDLEWAWGLKCFDLDPKVRKQVTSWICANRVCLSFSVHMGITSSELGIQGGWLWHRWITPSSAVGLRSRTFVTLPDEMPGRSDLNNRMLLRHVCTMSGNPCLVFNADFNINTESLTVLHTPQITTKKTHHHHL